MPFPVEITSSANSIISAVGLRNQTGGLLTNPFFDNASMAMPHNLKQMFKFCRWSFYSQSLIHSVVCKLSAYPITELVINPPRGNNSDVPDIAMKQRIAAWQELLVHTLRLPSFLITLGYDYYVYGSSFVLPVFLRDKIFTCTGCGTAFDQFNQSLRRMGMAETFMYNCPQCGDYRELKVEDSKSKPRIVLRRLPPFFIDPDYNDITGESTYYYTIPPRAKRMITKGEPEYLRTTPQLFIKAALTNQKLRFRPGRLYHFKREGLSEEDQGWPKPPILPVLKEVYQMIVLKRAQEAISLEHVSPLRVMYPNPTPGVLPAQDIGLGGWQNHMQESLFLQKQDPNHIAFSPIPVGVANIGGDARNLFITPELDFIKLMIINGLMVPREFIEGGTSFTGSSMSLRLLDNHFMNYRQQLEDFCNWLVRIIDAQLGLGLVHISFKSLKGADDVQKQNFSLNLNQRGMISDKYVTMNADADYESEQEQIDLEAKRKAKRNRDLQIQNAEASAEAQIIMMKGQVRAEFEADQLRQTLAAQQQSTMKETADKQKMEYLRDLDPQGIMTELAAGKLSLANVIMLFADKLIEADMMPQMADQVVIQINEVLAQSGIDPLSLNGLPQELANQIQSGTMSPEDVQNAIQQMIQEQQQAEAEAQAQQQAMAQGKDDGSSGGGADGGQDQPPNASPEQPAQPPASPQEGAILKNKSTGSSAGGVGSDGAPQKGNQPNRGSM